jgi:hypothetical protein
MVSLKIAWDFSDLGRAIMNRRRLVDAEPF